MKKALRVVLCVVFATASLAHATTTRTKFAYVGSEDGIHAYRLSETGAPHELPGSPFPFKGVKVMATAGEEYLVVAQWGENVPTALRVLKVDPNFGTLV